MLSKFNGRVFALGEALLDFITENGRDFTLLPGGSVVNAAISLSRIQGNVFLLSDLCNDAAGISMRNALHESGISTEYCCSVANMKSSIALAFLDSNKDAYYTFYKEYPADVPTMVVPDFNSVDVLLFGSSHAINNLYRARIESMLLAANTSGTMVYYDINVREKSETKLKELLPMYRNNMKYSSIVKGSLDDFNQLFGTSNPLEIYENCVPFCENLIITNGPDEVQLFTRYFSKTYAVPKVSVVSTIGAGDNFNAGFIFGLRNNGNEDFDNTITPWDTIIHAGISFASVSCTSIHNHINKQILFNYYPELIKI